LLEKIKRYITSEKNKNIILLRAPVKNTKAQKKGISIYELFILDFRKYKMKSIEIMHGNATELRPKCESANNLSAPNPKDPLKRLLKSIIIIYIHTINVIYI